MAAKRCKVYVDRTVQGAIAKRVILHWFFFFGLTSVSLLMLEYFLGDAQSSLMEHAGAVVSKYAFFFVLMMAIMPTFIYDTIKLSHRFAGPIVRLKESLRGLANGEAVPNMKFRDNDFWRELSEDFNRVTDRVRQASALPETLVESTTKGTAEQLTEQAVVNNLKQQVG